LSVSLLAHSAAEWAKENVNGMEMQQLFSTQFPTALQQPQNVTNFH